MPNRWLVLDSNYNSISLFLSVSLRKKKKPTAPPVSRICWDDTRHVLRNAEAHLRVAKADSLLRTANQGMRGTPDTPAGSSLSDVVP